MQQKSSKNSNKSNYWKTFDWFRTFHIQTWYNDLLKLVLLILNEPSDGPEKVNIDKDLNSLKNEMKILCDFEKMNNSLPKEISDFLEYFERWSSTREESLKTGILDVIFNKFQFEPDAAKGLIKNLTNLQVSQRSFLR